MSFRFRRLHRTEIAVIAAVVLFAVACHSSLERDNPIVPVGELPLGIALYVKEGVGTVTPQRVRLGRWLFYDSRLSVDNSVSCATCHRPEHAFSETRRVAIGVEGREGTRKSPGIINKATLPVWPLDERPSFAWDGRNQTLEAQVGSALTNPVEMASKPDGLVQKLSAVQGYRPYFEQAFGSPAVTQERIAHAIADYVRTRVSGNSPYDRKNGGDYAAMSPAARLGEDLFFDKARCNACHAGGNFTDDKFHNLGIGWDPDTQSFRDEGRFRVTHDPHDRGAFKTPGLRDVSLRGPFMHDGSIETLRGVIEFYNRGGTANPGLAGQLRPLQLTDTEITALLSFLESLNGEGYRDTPPHAFPQ